MPRKPDAVPGLVNAVETTPIRMLGATERDRGRRRRAEPGRHPGQRPGPQPTASAREDDPRRLGVRRHVGTRHAGQEDPGDQRGDERHERLGRGVERVGVGRQRPGMPHAERGDQCVRAEHVDDAADEDRADHRERHVAPWVAGLLGQRRRRLEPAERQHRQAEREQHVLGAARPVERRRGQAARPAPGPGLSG